MRVTTRIFAGLWLLSWFIIYLEIFRWHHMTPSLHLNPPLVPPGFPPPRPGYFLLGSIGMSIAAPIVFVTLLLIRSLRRGLMVKHR